MLFRRFILLAGVIAAMACSGDDNGGQGPGDGDGDGNETPEGDVLVRNDFFDPSELQVQAGATVVWTWASLGREHNVTFADVPPSGDQASGTYQRTFSAAGDYSYLCTIHGESMSGVISVTPPAPGGGGGGGGGGGDPYGDQGGY
jgi:plastocyanin